MKTYVIASAMINYRNKYLIGKGTETNIPFPKKYKLVSCFIKENESAENAIIQTIEEQTGLKGKITATGDSYIVNNKEKRWIIIPFLIEVENMNFVVNNKDYSELKWLNREELDQYEDIAEDIQGFRIAGIIK